jgi:hypothetical protein
VQQPDDALQYGDETIVDFDRNNFWNIRFVDPLYFTQDGRTTRLKH